MNSKWIFLDSIGNYIRLPMLSKGGILRGESISPLIGEINIYAEGKGRLGENHQGCLRPPHLLGGARKPVALIRATARPKRKYPNEVRIFLVPLFIFSFLALARADTVYLKDDREEKGIVVEDYHDRIVLSTVDGEKQIKKQEIKDIAYDRRQQNLLKLGDFHQQKGNLVKAYTYFRKAHQLDPDYKEARDRFIQIRSVLLRRPGKQLEDGISKKQALFKESGRIYAPKIREGISPTAEERLKTSAGLVLVSEDEMPKVDAALNGSPAQIAGIEKGDFIYSIWGRLTGYMELSQIYSMIMEGPLPEVTLAIKRNITIALNPDKDRRDGGIGGIGFSAEMKEEGLTVTGVKAASMAARQGLAKDDLITAIEGESTRYLPLKNGIRLIEQACSRGRVEVEVIRELTLWRKEA